ncbi:Low-density lipoprotein receptor domain class A [Opisthorchis viverrini]|uniref:Low-density lipoprotein receptor domain class A n=1 Tax=Opisthorchis viverrini TaxID=6198 RepID=A0A1S8X9Q8_OPIVI|nr:Low-density lipoprotein receptor domain class A [Opisthorchis viverrini]
MENKTLISKKKNMGIEHAVPSEYDKCNGTHFTCSGHSKLISRSFVCDGVADCEADGADEQECSEC